MPITEKPPFVSLLVERLATFAQRVQLAHSGRRGGGLLTRRLGGQHCGVRLLARVVAVRVVVVDSGRVAHHEERLGGLGSRVVARFELQLLELARGLGRLEGAEVDEWRLGLAVLAAVRVVVAGAFVARVVVLVLVVLATTIATAFGCEAQLTVDGARQPMLLLVARRRVCVQQKRRRVGGRGEGRAEREHGLDGTRAHVVALDGQQAVGVVGALLRLGVLFDWADWNGIISHV
jgi:hypothetical protein